MSFPTLLDIVKRNAADPAIGLIDETTKAHPEISLAAARPVPGIQFRTLVRKALGNTTGSFRGANAGTAGIVHQYENRLVECFILSPRFESDKAVADASIDGATAFIAEQTSGILEGEMQGLAKQFYYGTANNADGFPGLINAYDSVNMCVDAGGATDDTASSVWLVAFGPKDVQWVWGMDGKLDFSPVRTESVPDPNDATKKFDAYVQTMLARPGLQVASTQSVARIKKLTADNGKGLTDKLINAALALFPSGKQPTVILMNRRSLQQLQDSRTATSPTGAPAPFPTSIAGLAGQNIPIAVTDAISKTEKLAS